MYVGQPPVEIPQEAVDYIRSVFRHLNRRSASILSTVPNIHEEILDQGLIVELAAHPPLRLPQCGAIVHFTTYFLGGGRHYLNWEIADIGVAVNIGYRGTPVLTKVVLLQSKRLYANEDHYDPDEERRQFRWGFGGVFALGRNPVVPRTFSFTADSRYSKLQIGGEQALRIEAYQGEHDIPVEYMLYNPLQIPTSVDTPALQNVSLANVPNEVGTRIVPTPAIHALHRGAPQYRQVAAIQGDSAYAPFSAGWTLEDFIVDLLLGCHAGYATTAPNDTLYNLFNARNRPISAAFGVNIDVAAE
ncbi:MAG TPA: hypothetical protein VHS78_18130 [Candidatus Elarobacter sp.]|jgi:hypothetical protein|nr:hypothetical protein [Candidatus Elarobacter sp.]